MSSLVANPLLYSVGAPIYDWLTTHSAQRQAFEAVSEALPRSGRILDVACGPGALMAALSNGRRELVGVDLAAGALARASRHGLVRRADATLLPFPDSSFDAVAIAGALYLMSEPNAVLREMCRVTRGPIVVLEGSPRVRMGEALTGRGYELRERLDMAVWSVAIAKTQRYDAAKLGAVLRQASIEDIKVATVGRGLFLIASGLVSPTGGPRKGVMA